MEPRNPLVVLIGGTATSGKSTFISYVQEIVGANICKEFSTIDPVKEIVRRMFELEQSAIYRSLGLNNPVAVVKGNPEASPMMREINDKTDKYRSLLHDIKMLWCDIDDGPNIITFCNVQAFFKKSGVVAFVNVREPEQITHIIETLRKSKPDWKVITLNIVRDDVQSFSNQGDQDTNKFDYDITLKNNGTLEDLHKYASAFAGKYCF